MGSEISDENSRVLLNFAEQRRIHYSTIIVSVLGFVVASNIGIIGYFITSYIPEITTHPIYLFVGAALSSILTGAWRLYSHYIDNRITRLYPEIFYYESQLNIPQYFGISGYLHKNIILLPIKTAA
jgi:hypothetical protein